MISSSTGVIITDTVAHAPPSLIGSGSVTTGSGNNNGTTRSFKTRTLPSGFITPVGSVVSASKRNYNNLADGVDLVDDTKPDFHTKGKKNNNNSSYKERRLRRHKKMGASSSGGDGDCTATVKGLSNSSIVDDIEMHLGLTGWRKKCLYILLLLLMLLIITNLVLTLWILKVMEFSTEGMGQLKIVPGGIQLNGQSLIMDMLRASTIRSRHGQPISIESSRNFSINTRDMNGMLENHLFLGHDKLECLTKGFRINDTAGRNLFSVNRNEVTIGAHALRIDGEGGAIFRESIQTPHLRAEPGRELRLESPTRELEITAAKDINLQSRAGGIELTALEDVKLSTIDGSLHFESSKIFMPNLRTAQLPLAGTAQNHEHLHRVFQLCACSNGKLFLAAPHSICAGDDSSVCR
uniref:Delta-sarcoglycan n=1 Tax=Glossina austeni TaxID=7395 RepID=A0A1A9UZQ8_GLOAU